MNWRKGDQAWVAVTGAGEVSAHFREVEREVGDLLLCAGGFTLKTEKARRSRGEALTALAKHLRRSVDELKRSVAETERLVMRALSMALEEKWRAACSTDSKS